MDMSVTRQCSWESELELRAEQPFEHWAALSLWGREVEGWKTLLYILLITPGYSPLLNILTNGYFRFAIRAAGVDTSVISIAIGEGWVSTADCASTV